MSRARLGQTCVEYECCLCFVDSRFTKKLKVADESRRGLPKCYRDTGELLIGTKIQESLDLG